MYIYRLAHALGDVGHNVDVVHCVDSYHLLHPGKPEIAFTSHPKVQTHELRSGRGWLSPLLTQQTGRAFLKQKAINDLLKSKPYDVIHYHNISLLGPEVLTFTPKHNRAVKMYTTHEHWLICPTHVLWKFGERPCEKAECFQCTIKAKRPPQLWRLTNYLRDTSHHVDQFVSPSRFTATMHETREFPERVLHLPYFIDRVDNEWREPGPNPNPNPYFLFVGRLEKIKGLHTLIKTWANVNYDLLVAGSGPEAEELRALAASNPRIKFLGPLSQQQLGSLYYHAVACIVPSITYETFGIVIIEAFARKTPVIVRDLGALPEVVKDSGGGFIYRNDDELLRAIEELATQKDLRDQLGRKGYQSFVLMWSREAHLELYFSYLRNSAKRKFGYVPWEPERTEVTTPVLQKELAI